MILKCDYCGKEYEPKSFHKESKHHFCSRECNNTFFKDKPRYKLRKTNKIEFKDNFAIIHIENNLKGHFECLIDIEDISKINEYYWNIRYDKRHPNCLPYIETHKRINGKLKRLHLHRLIMNCPNDMVIDHINGNNLDNRKSNLRIVTQHQNTLNHNKAKNIYFNKRDNLYYVKFQILGKSKYLCYTRNYEEAEAYANLGKTLIFENKIEELFKIPCKVILHSYDKKITSIPS